MSFISVTDKYIAIAKNLEIDLYDYSNHSNIDVGVVVSPKPCETDYLNAIQISSDNKYLAGITSTSKQMVLYELPIKTSPKVFPLPRSASKIRFTVDNSHILVADKSGDVLIYDISIKQDTGTKLLGHLSLLLDILQTTNKKYIITSDRDEKIKVSCYPNTYNIQTFCLGHKEFVNHIELLPHDNKFLVSSSGDGTVKIWDYTEGKAYLTINTNIDVNDSKLKSEFTKKMDDEGIEVETLPIVHLTVSNSTTDMSLIAVSVYNCNDILIYRVNNQNYEFTQRLVTKVQLDEFPTAIQFQSDTLYVYNDQECSVSIFNFTLSNDSVSYEKVKIEKVFQNMSKKQSGIENQFDSIKMLYKRKFDNVQEYQERKKQRIEKTSIKSIY